MSRNFSFNTGAGGVALHVSSNQNIGFHTNRPTERVQFGAGNAKFNSNVFVGQSVGVGTSNPVVTVDIRATDALLLPRGNTAQRPSSNVQGYIRYNTSTGQFEGLGAGDAWGSLGGVSATNQRTFVTACNDDTIRFINSNAESARLTAQGRLGMGTSDPQFTLDIRATDAVLLPTGTTAQRPASNVEGLIRYNTETSQFEGLGAAGAWGSLGGVSATNQRTFVTACNDDSIRFVNSNLETVRLTTQGRLGLGASNPTERLEVVGNAAISSNLYVAGDAQVGGITSSGFVASHGLIVERTDPVGTSTLHAAKGVMAASNGDLWISTFCNNPTTAITFRDSTYTEFARLTNLGYLGLAGQSNPAAALHVAGAGIFGTAFSNVPSAAVPNNGLIIQGNVGIGLSNPLAPLHVNGVSIVYPRMALVQDRQNNNVSGGSSSVGWNKRIVNDKPVDFIGITLASNNFTIPAGTYHIKASAPGSGVRAHKIVLANSDRTTTYLVGTSENAPLETISGTIVKVANRSTIDSVVTFATSATLAIWHYTTNNAELGIPTNASTDEIYTQVIITQYA